MSVNERSREEIIFFSTSLLIGPLHWGTGQLRLLDEENHPPPSPSSNFDQIYLDFIWFYLVWPFIPLTANLDCIHECLPHGTCNLPIWSPLHQVLLLQWIVAKVVQSLATRLLWILLFQQEFVLTPDQLVLTTSQYSRPSSFLMVLFLKEFFLSILETSEVNLVQTEDDICSWRLPSFVQQRPQVFTVQTHRDLDTCCRKNGCHPVCDVDESLLNLTLPPAQWTVHKTNPSHPSLIHLLLGSSQRPVWKTWPVQINSVQVILEDWKKAWSDHFLR